MHRPPRGFADILLTAVLVGLIALATLDTSRWTFLLTLLGTVVLAVAAMSRLFPGSRFFVIALANSLGVYACIFQLFIAANFAGIGSPAIEIGFALPVLAFLAGAWRKREAIRTIVRTARVDTGALLAKALAWLLPIGAVGAASFLVPGLALDETTVEIAFVLAMVAIGLFVVMASPAVATFLIDTGLLFEEFFGQVRKLAAATFAYLTFYSVIVIVFAAVYRITDMLSAAPGFALGGTPRPISFPEALYFSVVTMATVGYGDITPLSAAARMVSSVQIVLGVLMLLFGFSEVLAYARERQRRGPGDGEHDSKQ